MAKSDGLIQYINPDSLHNNPAFSQAVMTAGKGKTLYIGGQNAVNEKGEIIATGDIAGQTIQALENMQTILSACGAGFGNIIKMTIYLVQGQNLYAAFQASQAYFNNLKNPPAVSVLVVAGLAHPDFLVEIDGVAFIPEE